MSTARNYVQRSPRYVFGNEEDSQLRFAGMNTRGIIRRATIRDLSESGLAFTLGETTPPDEGELLKIEFPIPGRKSIACFATVTRIESKNEWDPEWGDRGHTIVGLQFRHLPTLHVRAIRAGLLGKVDAESFDWERQRRTHGFALAGLTIALLLCMWLLTGPPTMWFSLFRFLDR